MIAEHTGSITEVGGTTAKTEAIRKSLGHTLLAVVLIGFVAVIFSSATAVLFLWIPIMQTYDAVIWTVFAGTLCYFMNRLVSGMDDRYYHET